jgi:hypothetical protein
MVEQNKELNGGARRERLVWAHPNKGMNPTRVKRPFYDSCVRSRVIPGVRRLLAGTGLAEPSSIWSHGNFSFS